LTQNKEVIKLKKCTDLPMLGGVEKKIMFPKRVLYVSSDVKLKSSRGLPERFGVKSTIQIAKSRKNWFLPEEMAFFVFLMNFGGQNTYQSA